MPRKIRAAKTNEPILTAIEQGEDPAQIAAENILLATDRLEYPYEGMRASSLLDSCAREEVIGLQFLMEKVQWLNHQTRLIYGIGNAIHTWIQEQPAVFGENRIGWWRCTACNKVSIFGTQRTEECPECKALPGAFRYEEHHVVTKDPYPCSGHPDLFIRKATMLRVVEIKTISSDLYDKLRSPYASHVWQIQYYMWACSEDQTIPMQIDGEVGYILYVSKGYISKQLPFKMFVILRDEYVLRQIKDKLRVFYDAQVTRILPPPQPACVRGDFKRQPAQYCPVKDICQRLFIL